MQILDKCKTLAVYAPIIECKTLSCQVNFFQGQTRKNSQLSQISKSFIIIYKFKKGTEMTNHEFYAQIQEDYYQEFAGAELSEIFIVTDVHPEFFEFDDVPF